MKKRLSLLLVMVMALTMVIGTGVCAWADGDNNICSEHNGRGYHFYSFDTTYTDDGNEYIYGIWYYKDHADSSVYTFNSTEQYFNVRSSSFISYTGAGWYWSTTKDNLAPETSGNVLFADPANPYAPASAPQSTASAPAHVHNFQY